MSESKYDAERAWIYTETVETWKMPGEWPSHNLVASINPVLDFVEVHASQRHAGTLIRMSKEDFSKWIDECRETLQRQSAHSDDIVVVPTK